MGSSLAAVVVDMIETMVGSSPIWASTSKPHPAKWKQFYLKLRKNIDQIEKINEIEELKIVQKHAALDDTDEGPNEFSKEQIVNSYRYISWCI